MHTCAYMKISIFSFFVFFTRTMLTVGIVMQSNFNTKNDKRMTPITDVGTLTPTAVDCARLCKTILGCIAANYRAETGTCHVFTKTCFVTEDAIGWNILSRISDFERTVHYIWNRTENWISAQEYCKSIGGSLANINTPADMEKIQNILSQFPNADVWLGGSDRDIEGEWVWTNGCRFVDQDFTFWAASQPDNHQNNQDCIRLTGAVNNKVWDDISCATVNKFVCEIYVA